MEPNQELLSRPAPEPSPKKVILLIDDCLEILLLNKTILEMAGYETVSARSGLEALQVLAKIEPPDLIILDMMMDQMSGPEFLEELRIQRPELHARIPVVFLSGMDEVPDVGAVGTIRKPIDIDKFIELVNKFISSRTPNFDSKH